MQQPRPRFPLQGHMGPHMMGPGPYGGHHHMMSPYGSNGQMMGLQQNFNGGRVMMGQTMGRGQGRRNGGGLLSKILGGKKQPNQRSGLGGIQATSRAGSGGTRGVGSILQTLSNPEGLTGFLNNTQQVLKTAQSFGPMIQQYGPIVKNLPVMWKLYKGFKDLPTDEKSVEEKSVSVEEKSIEEKSVEEKTDIPLMEEQSVPVEIEPKRKPKRKKPTVSDSESESVTVGARTLQNGPSVPKLYI